MILIFGDSWGCGEWDFSTVNASCNVHGGLGQFLKENGHSVINFSQGGISPGQIFRNIESFFRSGLVQHITEPIERIFIFQTDPARDSLPNSDTRYSSVDVPITDWYVRLSVLAKDYSVRFGLIGGITDTLPHNEVEDKFYGLYVACQSFTNLLLSDNDQTERPVFLIRPHREYIKYHFEQDTPTEKLVEMLDRINARMDAWKKNPQWFWPDGCHPNRLGHEKLYQFLKSRNLFG